MFLLIRPHKPQFVREKRNGFSDVIFILLKVVAKFFFKEYGVVAAGLALVLLGGIVYTFSQGKSDVWETLREQIWVISRLIGAIIIILFSLYHLFVISTKKGGPEKK